MFANRYDAHRPCEHVDIGPEPLEDYVVRTRKSLLQWLPAAMETPMNEKIRKKTYMHAKASAVTDAKM